MSGNVWEWVQDCWKENYEGAPTDGKAWLKGDCASGRVVRGASWNANLETDCRVANRYRYYYPYYNVGFRVVRD